MAKVTMHVLKEPLPDDVRVIVSFQGDRRPVLSGGGRTTLLCGACSLRIARRIDVSSLGALVLQCPRCCAHNALAAA